MQDSAFKLRINPDRYASRLRKRAAEVAQKAKELARVNWKTRGMGRDIRLFIPLDIQACMLWMAIRNRTTPSKMRSVFAADVVDALMENHGHKNPSASCSSLMLYIEF